MLPASSESTLRATRPDRGKLRPGARKIPIHPNRVREFRSRRERGSSDRADFVPAILETCGASKGARQNRNSRGLQASANWRSGQALDRMFQAKPWHTLAHATSPRRSEPCEEPILGKAG